MQQPTPSPILDEEDLHIMNEIKANGNYFAFLGQKISTHEIQSMLPYFQCEEPGHGENMLDQVCLDAACKNKGLCCVRCQYQKHRNHPNSVYPLHTFVGTLITQLQDRKLVLEAQVDKCLKYRDVVLSIIKDSLNQLIDHMTEFVAQVHKYHTLFQNSYENVLIRSQIIAHSLVYKKHIRRDKFQKYVRDSVKAVTFQKQSQQPSSDMYSLSDRKSPQPQQAQVFLIDDQERAFDITADFINEMQLVATKLQSLLKQQVASVIDQAQLHKLSNKIPHFEKMSSFEEINSLKRDLGLNVSNIFKSSDDAKSLIKQMPIETLHTTVSVQALKSKMFNTSDALDQLTKQYAYNQKSQYEKEIAKGKGAQVSSIPSIDEYLNLEHSVTLIDSSRQQCILGMMFETLTNCSILKQKSIKTEYADISCFTLLNPSLMAIGGRFDQKIEIYRTLNDRKHIQTIDTKSQQGVKCLLTLNQSKNTKGSADEEFKLIVGLYYDQASIVSYLVSAFKQPDGSFVVNCQNSGQYHKHDYDTHSAVTCLKEFYNGDYFVAGFSTGSVAVYHHNNPQPLQVIPHLYEKPVQGISIVEPGKTFVSFSQDKMRFHYVSQMSDEQIISNISPLKQLHNPCYTIQATEALMEEKSSLKLVHFICGEMFQNILNNNLFRKEGITSHNDIREQGMRFMRVMKEDVKVTMIEEGAISNFKEFPQAQSVKELVVIEPRRKIGKLWLLVLGENNRLQLWEIRRAMSQVGIYVRFNGREHQTLGERPGRLSQAHESQSDQRQTIVRESRIDWYPVS